MSFTNSSLATVELLSPNCTPNREGSILGVAIHCTAGSPYSTALQIAQVFQSKSKKASCNYAIGGDGSIALVVPEKSRSWCTSSAECDNHAVTIEVASDSSGLIVRGEALRALNKLLVDICRRNSIEELRWTGKKADALKWDRCNMQVHRWFASKACPGTYLFSLHPQIAAEVNGVLKAGREEVTMTKAEMEALIETKLNDRLAVMQTDLNNAFCPNWAKGVWERAAQCGVMDGKRPEAYLKRDELAAVLDRLGLLKEKEGE